MLVGIPLGVAALFGLLDPRAPFLVLGGGYIILCLILGGIRLMEEDELLKKWQEGGFDEEIGFTFSAMASLVIVFAMWCWSTTSYGSWLYAGVSGKMGLGTCLLYALDQAVNAVLFCVPGLLDVRLTTIRPAAEITLYMEAGFLCSFDALVIASALRFCRFIKARRGEKKRQLSEQACGMGDNMRAYLGFIPLAVVGIPFLVAAIRQALFYKGCMDGLGYMLVAMFAFMCGGALNLVYLLVVAVTHRTHFVFDNRRQRIAAKAGFIGAILLLVVQAVVVAGIAWKKLTMD